MKLTPTKQQQDIINIAKTGANLAIEAFAGSSKTTTCVMVAKEVRKPSLYLAFNKSIAEEANEKFPINVECKTIHSLAYKDIVNYKYKKKLQGFFDLKDLNLNYIFNIDDSNKHLETRLAAIDIIKLFCQSDSYGLAEFAETLEETTVVQRELAKIFWKNAINPDDNTKITHDVYLKLFQLSKPVLEYDVIYLDEAQDSNPVTLDIVLNQKAQLIIVGDRYQSIYEWRGAVNAFETILDNDKNFIPKYLTESFRFTQDIADMATKLTYIAGNRLKITGLAENKAIDNPTKAIIVRNNSTLMSTLLSCYENNQKVYCLADLKSVWGKLYHINNLYFGSEIKFPDMELKQYKTYKDLVIASESIPELAKLIKITIQLSQQNTLHNSITNIKSILVDNMEEANITITTAHKSKGLEWDSVTLTEDMFYLKEDETIYEALMNNQTLNLLYVAVTRVKYKVNLPTIVNEIIADYKNIGDNNV